MNNTEKRSHQLSLPGKEGNPGAIGISENTSNSGSNKQPAQTDDDDDDDEEEPVYIESSPCARWQKRRETVAQRDIPGIDASYLAMDTEEGVEVVWNEVLFSERKISDSQHTKVSQVFDKLIELNHMNIVKFHGYWQDRIKADDRPRVVFITEYISNGSLKTFLRKTKRTKQTLSKNFWKRWCIQLLSAINYLHSCNEPIIHGNLTCDTIFIQNTGLLKIGSIAPDVLHRHVKSISDSAAKNLHFQAPEIDTELSKITPAVDIYSLGVVTLEMINLDLGGNGETHVITDEIIHEAIDDLDNNAQKDLVLRCLQIDPTKRPTARQLLFHPALFEIPSLKLLSAHRLVDDLHDRPDRSLATPNFSSISSRDIFAEISTTNENVKSAIFTYEDCPSFDLDKLLEDVQNGLYPITAYHLLFPTRNSVKIQPDKILETCLSTCSIQSGPNVNNHQDQDSNIVELNSFHPIDGNSNNGNKSRLTTINDFNDRTNNSTNDFEQTNNETHFNAPASTSTNTFDNEEKETRRILDIQSKLKTKETGVNMLLISVKFHGRLQRDMTAEIEPTEKPSDIAQELVRFGLIHQDDFQRVEDSISRTLNVTTRNSDLSSKVGTASMLEVQRTAVVAATAALVTSQALQNQMNAVGQTNGILLDPNSAPLWTNTKAQPLMFIAD